MDGVNDLGVLYVESKLGKNNFVCCFATESVALEAYDRAQNMSREAWLTAYRLCACGPCGQQPSGGGGGTPPAWQGPPMPTLEAAISAATLPASCSDLKNYICSSAYGAIIAVICTAVPLSNPANKRLKALVMFVSFLCSLYKLACQDDASAAVYLLGLQTISDAGWEALAAEAGQTGTIGVLLGNLIGKLQQAHLDSSPCWTDLKTNNPLLAGMLAAELA